MNTLTKAKRKKTTKIFISGSKPSHHHGSAKILFHKSYCTTEWSPDLFYVMEVKSKEEFENFSNGANCHGFDFHFQHQSLTTKLVSKKAVRGVKKIVNIGTVFIHFGEIHYETLNFIKKANSKKVDFKWGHLFETAEEIFSKPNIRVAVILTRQKPKNKS